MHFGPLDSFIGHLFEHIIYLFIFTSVDVPSVRELIDGNEDMNHAEFELKKWTALLWILDLKLEADSVEKLRAVPRESLPAVITVLFLLWVSVSTE